MSEQRKIIGIDLGTTNSVLGVVQDGRMRLVPIGADRLLPSVVGIAPSGDVLQPPGDLGVDPACHQMRC
jgi:molecular chaperone DnaK (HSP70)